MYFHSKSNRVFSFFFFFFFFGSQSVSWMILELFLHCPLFSLSSDCFQMCLSSPFVKQTSNLFDFAPLSSFFANIFLLFICVFVFLMFLYSKCCQSQVFCLHYGFKKRKMTRDCFSKSKNLFCFYCFFLVQPFFYDSVS